MAARAQIRVLAVRQVRFYLRNPDLVLAKLFTYIFMGCFMGARAAGAPPRAARCGRREQAVVRQPERWVTCTAALVSWVAARGCPAASCACHGRCACSLRARRGRAQG